VEIDFEDVWALFGEGKDGIVAKLCAFVQFQLSAIMWSVIINSL
jgi:hypothetical protein